MSSQYTEWLKDYSLIPDEQIASEFKQVFEDFHEMPIHDNFDVDATESNSSGAEDQDDDDDELIPTILVFKDADFVNVADDVKQFMLQSCGCKKGPKKNSCSNYFKPLGIDQMRDDCELRDTWEKGINLLNELILGQLLWIHSSFGPRLFIK